MFPAKGAAFLAVRDRLGLEPLGAIENRNAPQEEKRFIKRTGPLTGKVRSWMLGGSLFCQVQVDTAVTSHLQILAAPPDRAEEAGNVADQISCSPPKLGQHRAKRVPILWEVHVNHDQLAHWLEDSSHFAQSPFSIWIAGKRHRIDDRIECCSRIRNVFNIRDL